MRLGARYLPLVFLVAASGTVFLTGAYRHLGLDQLIASRAWLQDFVAADRPRAMLAAFGIYTGAIALSIPVSAILTMVCGLLFGWAAGAAVAVASATSGAVIVFLVARTALGDVLARRAGPRLQRLAAGFGRDAFTYVLILRLLPIVPFWITNLGAALFGAPLKAFAPATLIGIVPASLAFATAGSGIESVVAAHQRARAACLAASEGMEEACADALAITTLITPQLLAALAALALLALLPILVRHLRRSREAA